MRGAGGAPGCWLALFAFCPREILWAAVHSWPDWTRTAPPGTDSCTGGGAFRVQMKRLSCLEDVGFAFWFILPAWASSLYRFPHGRFVPGFTEVSQKNFNN